MGNESKPESTRKVIQKAQAGDPQAFGLLVKRYRHRLESVIGLRLGPRLRLRVEVEDVLQETYINAFSSIRKFQWRGEGSFLHWLCGIAENVIKNQARHHFRTLMRNILSQNRPGADSTRSWLIEAKGESPSKAARRNERFERLEKALASLSRDHREVIILARLEGMPIKDIALRMERSADAISMLLLRALRQLKVYFGTTDSLHLPARSLENTGSEAQPLRDVANPSIQEALEDCGPLSCGLETSILEQLKRRSRSPNGTRPDHGP